LLKNKIFYHFIIILGIVLLFQTFSLANEIYGCPADEVIMFKRGICSERTQAERVEEARIFFGNPLGLYFNNLDLTKYSIDPDSKESVVVIYDSSSCGKKTFRKDNCSSGNPPKGRIIQLRYYSGYDKSYDGMLSSDPLSENIINKYPIKNFDLSNQSSLLQKKHLENAFESFKKDMRASGITDINEIKNL